MHWHRLALSDCRWTGLQVCHSLSRCEHCSIIIGSQTAAMLYSQQVRPVSCVAKPPGRVGFFCCFDPSLADADSGEIWHKGPDVTVGQEFQPSTKVSTWLHDPQSAEPEDLTSASSCQTSLDPDGDVESIG